MDRETAKMILETANDCASELGSLVPLLKKNCQNVTEYEKYGKKVGKAIAYIVYELEEPLYDLYPDLKKG